ncbi:MAG TPA: pilus assembly protein TadG-related protein [Rhizomicrobium sp.]|jgi:Flp pilus assembly protein TadG|nr:pilus assembly protein TadG-related protein [Rhizomicrobium sp.]
MSPRRTRLLARICQDARGAISVLAGLCMTVLIGMVGLGVDFGYVYYCQARLQTTTDAAALAGAENINVGTGGTAVGIATHYSASGSGALNKYGQASVSMAPGYPVLQCLRSTGVSCSGTDNANAIKVSQTAVVPTFFARLFGLSTWNISATSLASARGGTAQPVDVEIILDTTASMNDPDPNCTIPGATREQCAVRGVQTLLSELAPCSATLASCGSVTNGNVSNPIDRVGLMVFPGLQAGQTQYEYDCSSSPSPQIASYAASPVYQIVPFSSDFRSSDRAPSLNTTSNLVLAARGGAVGCQQGLSAVGGVGTFFADAISAAQSALASDGRRTARKVIILLSDGAANAKAANMPPSEASNQCHAAVTAANTAAAAGTWVYSIAYGASTNASDCPTDTPSITPCSTMQQVASDSSKYFSDTSGGDAACISQANSISQLSLIFGYIGVDASTARLLPLDTT